MFIMFAKVQPFLKELREKAGDPEMFGTIEKVIMSFQVWPGTFQVHAQASRNDAGEDRVGEGELEFGRCDCIAVLGGRRGVIS